MQQTKNNVETRRVLTAVAMATIWLAGVADANVITYPAPEGSPVSTDYAVTVEGKESAVYGVPSKYKTPACFSPFDTTGPVTRIHQRSPLRRHVGRQG